MNGAPVDESVRVTYYSNCTKGHVQWRQKLFIINESANNFYELAEHVLLICGRLANYSDISKSIN